MGISQGPIGPGKSPFLNPAPFELEIPLPRGVAPDSNGAGFTPTFLLKIPRKWENLDF